MGKKKNKNRVGGTENTSIFLLKLILIKEKI